jgi:hypothetical protein
MMQLTRLKISHKLIGARILRATHAQKVNGGENVTIARIAHSADMASPRIKLGVHSAVSECLPVGKE